VVTLATEDGSTITDAATVLSTLTTLADVAAWTCSPSDVVVHAKSVGGYLSEKSSGLVTSIRTLSASPAQRGRHG